MNNELMKAILIADGNTPLEAEKRIRNQTALVYNQTAIIYESFAEYEKSLKDSDVYDGETIEAAKNGKIRDLSYIEYNGHDYFIEYIN